MYKLAYRKYEKRGADAFQIYPNAIQMLSVIRIRQLSFSYIKHDIGIKQRANKSGEWNFSNTQKLFIQRIVLSVR